jgi:soluble lytic murein transglycosylase-like protein
MFSSAAKTAHPDAFADLAKATEGVSPPVKPAAVQVGERALRSAREIRAEAEGRHYAALYSKDAAGRTLATAEQRAAAEALAEASAKLKAARQELTEAREKWRPSWRKAVQPVADHAEAILRDGLMQIEAASAALTALDLEAERHGGMPKPGLVYQARAIAFALDGLKRALKRS